jgi:hypothetical protein
MQKIPHLSISPEKAFFAFAKSRQSDSNANELDLGESLRISKRVSEVDA